jgi:hypothetical protein
VQANEKKALLQILENCKDPSDEPKGMRQLRTNFTIWFAISLTIAFVLSEHSQTPELLLSLLVFASGIFAGFSIFLSHGIKQWKVIKPHINQQSISEKLDGSGT